MDYSPGGHDVQHHSCACCLRSFPSHAILETDLRVRGYWSRHAWYIISIRVRGYQSARESQCRYQATSDAYRHNARFRSDGRVANLAKQSQ